MWCNLKNRCDAVVSFDVERVYFRALINRKWLWCNKFMNTQTLCRDLVAWGAVWLHGVLYWDVRGLYDMKIEIPNINLIFSWTKSWKTNTEERSCCLVCSRLIWYGQDMYFLKLPINLATCPCLVVGFSEDFQLLLANVLSRRVHAFGSHVPCS